LAPKSADYVAFGATSIADSAILLSVLGETHLTLNADSFKIDALSFKITKAVQCCVVRPHAAVLDFAHTLPAKANVAAQIQLRQANFPTQVLEVHRNIGFSLR
jgi:hypothetical protein